VGGGKCERSQAGSWDPGLGGMFSTTASVCVACSVDWATGKVCENVTVATWKESFKPQSHNAAYWHWIQRLCHIQGAGCASVYSNEVVESQRRNTHCSLHQTQTAVTHRSIISDTQSHVPGMGAGSHEARQRNTSTFVLPQRAKFMFCVTTSPQVASSFHLAES
jgi:hypothetical protein